MLTSRLLGIFVVVSALVSPGAEFAVARDAPANDFSSLLEWKNQIAADIEHNRRYLPGVRTRGKIGVVYFDLNINRAGWVLPGTRIVTVDRELGSAALLLLQQSQPFPAPEGGVSEGGTSDRDIPHAGGMSRGKASGRRA